MSFPPQYTVSHATKTDSLPVWADRFTVLPCLLQAKRTQLTDPSGTCTLRPKSLGQNTPPDPATACLKFEKTLCPDVGRDHEGCNVRRETVQLNAHGHRSVRPRWVRGAEKRQNVHCRERISDPYPHSVVPLGEKHQARHNLELDRFFLKFDCGEDTRKVSCESAVNLYFLRSSVPQGLSMRDRTITGLFF